MSQVEVTVVLPCLNEAETVGDCVSKAAAGMSELGVDGEVVVSDNGSTDGSQRISAEHGARVVDAPVRGYGGALMAGIDAARGRYVIMADADDSYDLEHLGAFVNKLREGHEVVMGNRFAGGIEPGAMPPLHRYLGNPALSWLGRHLFGLRGVGDFHCGIRGFSRDRIRDLHLCMPGMEFASELVVRASLAGYSIVDVPTTLRRDGRSRAPHLRTWRDGWRHLRFLLVLAPRPTLIWPGTVLATLGALAAIALTLGPVRVGSIAFDVNALAFACMAVLVGVQLVLFGGFAMIYGRFEGLVAERTLARWTRWLRLERCAAIGLTAIAVGSVGAVLALSAWGRGGFGDQDTRAALRVVLPAVTLIATGTLTIFSGLFGSLLALRVAGAPATPVAPAATAAPTRREGSPIHSAMRRRREAGRSAPRR